MIDFAPALGALDDDRAALLDALLARAARDRSSPEEGFAPRVVPIRETGDRLPLFMVHGSGGRALFLHDLARHMAAGQPVYGIEAAANGPKLDRSALCDQYLAAMRSIQPDGPYRIGGYSGGALIAFEMAARLGDQVDMVLMIDPVSVPEADQERSMNARERLEHRFRIARLAGITPLSSEFPRVGRVNRDFATVARDFPTEPIDVKLHIVRATIGDDVCSTEAAARWASLARRGCLTASLATDHAGIVRDPCAADLSRLIEGWIDAINPGS
ncbi:MAG: thioesterase domain-containing protein [Sphingomonas sp.]